MRKSELKRKAAMALEQHIGLAIKSVAEDPNSLYYYDGLDEDRMYVAGQMFLISAPFIRKLRKLGAFHTCVRPLPGDNDE